MERDLVTKYEDLQNQIELLSAMRNVSHVVNDAVEFHSILEEVMRIVADLTGALEITIYLVDEDTSKLLPAAHRSGETVVFDDDIKRLRIDKRNVYQAIQHQTIFRDRHGHHIRFTIPLTADQESLGVLSTVLPLTGEVDEIAADMERCEAILVSLAKHISLAIKTPLLYNRAVVDSLTKLYTKRHFHLQLTNYFYVSRRLEKEMSLIMMDIDNFKKINDTYGHLTGDKILAEIGDRISKTIRQYDSAYRYGGEEIAILLAGVGDGRRTAGGGTSARESREAPLRECGRRETARYGEPGRGEFPGRHCRPQDPYRARRYGTVLFEEQRQEPHVLF